VETYTVHSRDNVSYVYLEDDGIFPNNARFPLLKYSDAVPIGGSDPAAAFENLFNSNDWVGSWRNGVYNVHHYHSSAHEVLGVYSGSATVQFGGEQGVRLEVKAGDVAVVPAGVAHKRLRSSGVFGVVGAYPVGQKWDMCYGREGERPGTDRVIAAVPIPGYDPVLGADGPLVQLWTG
jgi:uncharacterized protein YjlB